jgi:hypothetical protein
MHYRLGDGRRCATNSSAWKGLVEYLGEPRQGWLNHGPVYRIVVLVGPLDGVALGGEQCFEVAVGEVFGLGLAPQPPPDPCARMPFGQLAFSFG